MLQNYNKILTKRTVFWIILEWNPDQDLHKKIRIFYASRFFSGQNRKKCANYASKYGNLKYFHIHYVENTGENVCNFKL